MRAGKRIGMRKTLGTVALLSLLSLIVSGFEFPPANYYDPGSDCKKVLGENLPVLENDIFYRTKNNFGYMQRSNDIYSQAFVEDAVRSGGLALDVGSAYGVATLEILRRGGNVIASDIDRSHLNILWSQVPDEYKSRLRLYFGGLPSGLDLPSNSIDSILASRVFHFLSGEDIQASIKEFYRLLRPGGRVFVTAETPFLLAAKRYGFLSKYMERKKAGDPWPGLVTDVQKIYPTLKIGLPNLMNYMDPDVLEREFLAAGFVVNKVGTFARPEFPREAQMDGRESVGIFAVKP